MLIVINQIEYAKLKQENQKHDKPQQCQAKKKTFLKTEKQHGCFKIPFQKFGTTKLEPKCKCAQIIFLISARENILKIRI